MSGKSPLDNRELQGTSPATSLCQNPRIRSIRQLQLRSCRPDPVESSSSSPPDDLIAGLGPLRSHRALVMGVASDTFVPAWQQREIPETWRAAGNRSELMWNWGGELGWGTGGAHPSFRARYFLVGFKTHRSQHLKFSQLSGDLRGCHYLARFH